MKQKFLEQFLDKISKFPSWVKEIIYNKLSDDIGQSPTCVYEFVSYKPILTYSGKCELDYKKCGFDTNIYNMLKAAGDSCSISDIIINSFFSMEEAAKYFLFCVEGGYFEVPDNHKVVDIANILSGKTPSGNLSYEEIQKRFVLDYNEVPKINSDDVNIYTTQINELKAENRVLKQKLEQLLSMVNGNV